MQTIEQLRGKIESAEELHSVVRTMKGLAAVNIRQYERAVESLSGYAETIRRGLQVLLQREPFALPLRGEQETAGPVLAVVFGSDQGMVGRFNSRIVEHAASEVARHGGGAEIRTVSVGRRLAGNLLAGGWDVVAQFALPRSVETIVDHAREVLLEVQALREKGAGRVLLFHHLPLSGASYKPRTRPVFPLDLDWLARLREEPWPTRMLPTFGAAPEQVFPALIRSHLFASVYRAFAESLAAENASRMASMQAAEKNIEERKEQLRTLYHRRRQSKITEELLDVMAGFETTKR